MADKNPNTQTRPSIRTVPLDDVRGRLATVWLVGSLLIVGVMIVQSLLGRYGDKAQEAWGWLLPTLMPSLTMILTVLGYTALSATAAASVVRRDFCSLSSWLSGFYLAVVALTIVIQPIAAHSADEAVGLMRLSNLWLGPLQGLVSSVLGVLFVSRQKGGARNVQG